MTGRLILRFGDLLCLWWRLVRETLPLGLSACWAMLFSCGPEPICGCRDARQNQDLAESEVIHRRRFGRTRKPVLAAMSVRDGTDAGD